MLKPMTSQTVIQPELRLRNVAKGLRKLASKEESWGRIVFSRLENLWVSNLLS
jgi:hypothetical protein